MNVHYFKPCTVCADVLGLFFGWACRVMCVTSPNEMAQCLLQVTLLF